MSDEGSYSGVGIDLGTSFCCIGIWDRDHAEILPSHIGSRKIPACLAFSHANRFMGDAAKDQITVNPSNTIFNLKRLMGRKSSDPSIHRDVKNWPFKLGFGAADRPLIDVQYKGEEKSFYPEEICGMILENVKKIAEDYLGRPVKNVVVTIPANFTIPQRQATLDACAIARLNARLITEACAAVLCYAHHWELSPEENLTVLVMDVGGGKTHVSIINVESGRIIDTKASAGDSALGGEDFLNRMVNHCIQEFQRRYKKNIGSNTRALIKLRNACEKAKKALSTASKTTIEVDSLYEGTDFTSIMTRHVFEDINMDLFERCLFLVEQCLEDAQLHRSEINEIIVVGGSVRIPKVQEMLRTFFNGKELCKMINPDEAIARGAAIYATIWEGNNAPDLTYDLVDVFPTTIGFEAPSGLMTVLFPKLQTIPSVQEVIFSTYEDYQSSILVRVYEGEKPKSRQNKLIMTFEICDIPISPKGAVQVLVVFQINVNGILSVSAKDANSERQLTVIEENFKFRKEEIESMRQDAEKLMEDDEDYRAKIEARNKIEEEVFNMKNIVQDEKFARMLDPKDKKRLKEAMNGVVQCLDGLKEHEEEGEEWSDIRRRMIELEMAWNEVFGRLAMTSIST